MISSESAPSPIRPGIAVIGTGPRGLAVLEAIGATLRESGRDTPFDLYAIDGVEVGCGRVWRTDQPPWFLMNTVAGEVTMFSGEPDGSPARPGAGPSLAQWWAEAAPEEADANGYAPRYRYGQYLSFVLRSIERALPEWVRLHRVHANADELNRRPDGRFTISLTPTGPADAPGSIIVDRVVLTTGHPPERAAGAAPQNGSSTRTAPGGDWIRAITAADMPLDRLPPARPVGVLGLGLTFYDVLAALTIGRGGRFVQHGGDLRYLPSGREPLLVAGSRSGVPFLARGRNQKRDADIHDPGILTMSWVHRQRLAGDIHVVDQLMPRVTAEVQLVYYVTALRNRAGGTAAGLLRDVLRDAGENTALAAAAIADFGLTDLPPLNLRTLAHPFAGRHFTAPNSYTTALVDFLEADLRAAELGNVLGPLKAALDVLRDLRPILRAAIDFGGLHPRSQEREWLGEWAPMISQLSAGPPAIRVQQAIALLRSGVLRVVGPEAQFALDPQSGRYRVSSPAVTDSGVDVDTVIDARLPPSGVTPDDTLIGRLTSAGMVSSYVNRSRDGRARFDTRGAAVTRHSHHPIGADGQPEPGLHLLGIPTENTRWFTQVGSGRPGRTNDFTGDAAEIAGAVLDAVCPRHVAALRGTR